MGDYSIEFEASGPHMSLAGARLDSLANHEGGDKPVDVVEKEEDKEEKNNTIAFGFKNVSKDKGEFAEWKTFTKGYGDPGNEADVSGSKSGAKITQAVPGAMVTSTGNIYSPAAATKFKLTDSVSGKLESITLQIWTKGVPADYQSFKLIAGDTKLSGNRLR